MESSVLQSKSFLPSWDDIENVKKKEKKKGERRIVFRNCRLNVESTILILPVLFFSTVRAVNYRPEHQTWYNEILVFTTDTVIDDVIKHF